MAASHSQPYRIELSMEDADLLYTSVLEAYLFRSEDQGGRFNFARPMEDQSMPELLLAEPDFDEGTILWFPGPAEALLTMKIHEAAGHRVFLLSDNRAPEESLSTAMLTSWNMHSAGPQYTEAPVLVELVLTGGGEDSPDEIRRRALERVNAVGSQAGEERFEDHGDHFHLVFLFTAPGIEVRKLALGISQEANCKVAYNVMSED